MGKRQCQKRYVQCVGVVDYPCFRAIFAYAKLQKAVRWVAAPTTQLDGVLLHRYFDVAVNIAVDAAVYM